jgi:two-component system sensor histidine kinase CpxA
MIGKNRLTLSTKILLVALANLALLFLAFFIYVRLQLRQEFESFLLSASRERIMAVSRQLALELHDSARSERDELLARYSSEYGVTFLVINIIGDVLAGPAIPMPQSVRDRVVRPPDRVPQEMRRLRSDTFFTSRPFLITAEGPYPYWVGVRMPVPDYSGSGMVAGTLLIAARTFWTNPFFFQMIPWLVIGSFAVGVSLLCWLPLIRGLTRSIGQMMRATAHIAEGRFDAHVQTGRHDELGQLGIAINRMASRLETLVQGQKRFLRDVAHELRSPIARMQVGLGILERQARPEDQNCVSSLKEEIETMSGLTDELLAAAKGELRPEAVRLEPVAVIDIINRAVKAERSPDSNIEISADPGIRALADSEHLFRAVANVLRNALRYAGRNGPVRITADRVADHVTITVADSGPGVPEGALENLFLPFYRVDSSRDRRSGGTGLGLAIVRSSVEACRGSVECRNRKPSGLEVTIRLPAA